MQILHRSPRPLLGNSHAALEGIESRRNNNGKKLKQTLRFSATRRRYIHLIPLGDDRYLWLNTPTVVET